ncbi:MAG: ArsR/SmtB family transcription factor [Acidimicrobiia bacterium]
MTWTLAGSAHAEELAAICGGLADPKRVRLLAALREGEHSVGDLAELIGATQPSVSHHLGVLRSKRMVTVRRSGTRAYYEVPDPRITNALDSLYGLLTGEEAPPAPRPRAGPPAPPPPRPS